MRAITVGRRNVGKYIFLNRHWISSPFEGSYKAHKRSVGSLSYIFVDCPKEYQKYRNGGKPLTLLSQLTLLTLPTLPKTLSPTCYLLSSIKIIWKGALLLLFWFQIQIPSGLYVSWYSRPRAGAKKWAGGGPEAGHPLQDPSWGLQVSLHTLLTCAPLHSIIKRNFLKKRNKMAKFGK